VLRKPAEIRDHLITSGTVSATDFQHAAGVTEAELREVHTTDLIARLHDPSAVAMAIEVPEAAFLPPEVLWSAVVEPQLLAAGGTCEALRAATAGEWSINLSGGFHHARRDLSHGFCLANDVALAIARLRREGLMRPTLIVDLDLHQGDGNASIFENDDDVFTLSVHEEYLFPMPKMRSDLDIGLPARTGDEEYLRVLDDAFVSVCVRASRRRSSSTSPVAIPTRVIRSSVSLRAGAW
jgi:histone deacetylase 11